MSLISIVVVRSTSRSFPLKLTLKAGLSMSMTEKNHSAENAVTERVNGILKQEYWLDANFAVRQEARQATDHGIRMYNTRRPHTALKFATPDQVYNAGSN